MKIPWWGKMGAKLILSRLPLGYDAWQRLGLFRHGRMDAREYAVSVFNGHVERAGMADRLLNKTVLELGPGDSIASAVIAAAKGAKVILVDRGDFARHDLGPYLDLVRMLKEKGPSRYLPELSDCRTTKELLARCGALYMTEGLKSLAQIEKASVDLIFSQAVLEHIRKKEFLEMMRECHRILKPGGVCSHKVDLRDHLGGALNNLRFSEPIWESRYFVASNFYTNRIRCHQMLRLFSDAGFEVEVAGVLRWDDLPTARNKLAPEFRDLPDDEIKIYGFDVLLRNEVV